MPSTDIAFGEILKDYTLEITEEQDRRNTPISSVFYGRISLFHPSQRLTPKMISRLTDVAKQGGTDLSNPLESVDLEYDGRKFNIGLHVDYLLHPHRDVLEMIIAYARIAKLSNEDVANGIQLTWLDVLSTIEGINIADPHKEGRAKISNDATVFSISMYDLASRLKIRPHRDNYDVIERRIVQLATAKISISELDTNNNTIDVIPFSFIDSFRFCFDPSKNKNNRANSNSTNHIFIVLSNQLVEAILSHPARHYREDQYKITHYSSLPLRSLIKWLTTHKPDYLHCKKMEWVLDQYIASLAIPTSPSFRSKLKKELLNNADQIRADYDLTLEQGSKGDYQFFNVNQ